LAEPLEYVSGILAFAKQSFGNADTEVPSYYMLPVTHGTSLIHFWT